MRKNILAILTFLFLFILSGCGSNSKPDGDTTPTPDDPVAVEMQNNYIVQDESGINFTLAIPITKKLDSSYRVELNGYGLTVDGCTMSTTPSYSPATLSLSGEYDSVEILYITGAFDQNCTIGGYTFTATQKVTKGSDVDIRPFSAAFDYDNPGGGGTTPPPVDGYAYYNATTPLEITQANTAYTLKVQLLNDGFIAEGETVKLMAFSANYGDVESYSVVTGADGYANFNYKSPLTLPANGTIQNPLEIVFKDENNNTYSQEIVLNFQSTGGGSEFSLINETTPIQVTSANTAYEISTYVVDNNNEGVSDKTVSISTIANGYGSVGSTTATTDASGKAVFIYTSPLDLAGLTSTTATLRFEENGLTLEKTITINITPPAGGGTVYSLINETTPIEVTSANEVKEISVYVVDSATQIGTSDKTVSITTIANGYGSVSSATATTDGSGKAVFNYTAPLDLTGLTSTTATLSFVEDNVTIQKTVTINVTPPAGGGSQYSLINETTPVIITRADQVEVISINLVNSTTLVGVEGKNITLSTPAFGDLSTSIATTNTAGKAEFGYQAPSDLTGLTTTTIRFSFIEDSVTVTKDINITVNPTGTASEYTLTNANDITVNYPTQSGEIAVQVIKNGAPVAGESVTAKSIPVAFGRIENATVTTGADGYARFTYIAADTLTDGTQPLELVHIDENGAEATATVSIVVAEKALYDFINLSNITITHGSQKEDIKGQLTYKGVPVAGKTVQMLAFSDINGTILNGYSVVTDSVGYATFFYMAPETLDDVNSTTLTLTIQFDEDVIHIESHPTVSFDEAQTYIEGNVTLPIVVIPDNQREVILNSNSMTFDIPIAVWKDIAPYTEGSVKVEFPEKVLNGVDVGLFASYEVAVNDKGIAIFSYTGPSNLQSLISNDDNESIFKFYHIENSENKQEMKVLYQLPLDPHISRNYELDIVTSGDFSMGIPDKEKTFNVVLKAKDSTGNDVSLDTENITKITVLTTNSTIAQILDISTSTLVNSLELDASNNSPFILKSKELSGLVPLEVTIEFDDANTPPNALSISTIVNVRVFSGPASAISISYVSTGQDVDRAKYIETLAISVTDEYGNRVNTRPNITLGAIVGYAVDGVEASGNETNETKRLFYGRSDVENGNANGEIIALGANTANFEDNTPARADVFKYVNAEGNNTDKLVVFGEQKNYEAMGKWDITKINDNTLSLQDDYYGVDRSGLYYAVGHNYYQDQCREDGREWVGSTDSETYQLDDEGTVTVTYKYDYHLTGKDALVWVNLDGIQPDTGAITRVGETVKHTLRGTGLVNVPEGGYTLAKGTAGYGTFIIWHENAPEHYRNAHFGWASEAGSTCAATVVARSNSFDARTCNNSVAVNIENNTSLPSEMVSFGTSDGTSYITFYLEAPIDKDCTFNLERILPSSEF